MIKDLVLDLDFVVLVLFLENDEEENAKEATTGRSSGST